jgi:hypothetical protein
MRSAQRPAAKTSERTELAARLPHSATLDVGSPCYCTEVRISSQRRLVWRWSGRDGSEAKRHFDDPAVQVLLEFSDDESGQAPLLPHALLKAWPVLGNRLVENRLLWTTPGVAVAAPCRVRHWLQQQSWRHSAERVASRVPFSVGRLCGGLEHEALRRSLGDWQRFASSQASGLRRAELSKEACSIRVCK